MNEEFDLVGYLPPFLAEYGELCAALKAENPEFEIIESNVKRVLDNQFIETADEYGISRFEKFLGILPQSNEPLESRRSRVLSRWFSEVPYTLQTLLLKLKALCGEGNFSVEENYDFYEIKIKTELELLGQVDELLEIIDSVVPCNMRVFSENTIPCVTQGCFGVGAGVQFVEIIGI